MMMLILLLVVAGGVVLVYTLRSSAGGTVTALNARLNRYGLSAPGATVTVVSTPTGKKRPSAFSTMVETIVERGGIAGPLAERLDRADLKMTPAEWVSIAVVIFMVAALAGLILRGTVGLLALGAAGLVGPWIYLKRRTTKRKRAFVEQLADMAQMMGNSMRAGFSIIQSMDLVANEGSPPASQEFERVVMEVKLGLPVDTALEHLLKRQPSEDLELMVVAINVQRQIGGNLSEILMVISQTIRERVRFERDLRALTAQARYSSYIITALPIAVAAIINFMDYEYESMLYTTMLGWMMLGTAVCMLGAGFFVLSKIANIEV